MNDEMISLLRNDFLAFARKAIVELTGTKLENEPYIEYLASELMKFIDGETKRLLINLPPRHLKTLLGSVCLAAWKLAHEPSAKIMVVTYAEHLAESIARYVRRILQSAWFKGVFKTRIAKDHSAVMDFATTAGGALYAVSIGGSITGRGADLIIVDDPHDLKDAGRPQQLEDAIERFKTVVLSRLNNRRTGQVIVIAHRIHEDDLSGHLLRQGKWRHVVLPMVALSDASYETDYGRWGRQEGDLLRPDAYDAEDIKDLKAQAHNPDFDMLYQQNAEDRALPAITADCFRNFAAPPSGDHALVMSIDPGMTPGLRNSFTVIQIWCPVGDNHYLLEQWREQCEYKEFERRARLYFKRYRPCAVLVEKAANGHALISVLKPKYHKLIHEIVPEGSKTARLRRHVELILAHKINLPKDAFWRADFVSELVRFPHADSTDQVDATTQYLDWIAGRPKLKPLPRPALGAVAGSRGQRIAVQADPRFSYMSCRNGVAAISRRWP